MAVIIVGIVFYLIGCAMEDFINRRQDYAFPGNCGSNLLLLGLLYDLQIENGKEIENKIWKPSQEFKVYLSELFAERPCDRRGNSAQTWTKK